MAVIDTNMDLIESLDDYEETRDDPTAIEAVQNLEKVNRILREHLDKEQPLTVAELNMLGVYTSTARGSYTQKLVACNKMIALCREIEDKILSCIEQEDPSKEFYSKFSEKLDLSID